MTRHLVRLFVAVAFVAGAVSAFAEDTVMFAYHFEAGSSNRYRVKFNQDADIGGNAMGQIADLQVTLKCTAVDGDKHTMQMVFDKVDVSRQMMDNMMADPAAEKLVGHSVTFMVTGLGEVSDVKPDGYFDGWDQIQQFIEPVVEGWYVHMPGKAYPVGGEWSDNGQKEKGVGGMDVVTNAHFKFKEKKSEGGRECAFVTSEIENILSGISTTAMGAYKVEGGGKGKFEFFFDPKTTLLVKFKGKMDVQMKLAPESGSASVMESNVTYQIERELL